MEQCECVVHPATKEANLDMETNQGTACLPWGDHPISIGDPAAWHIGNLGLWCRQEPGEIRITHAYHEEAAPQDMPMEDASWSRWALKRAVDTVRILPALPNRPVVVQPDSPFRIATGARAKVFVRVPLWARIEIPDNPPLQLTEIPSVVLSNTWFGSFIEGELCYWLSSKASSRIGTDDFEPHLALCPLKIENDSGEVVLVEKLRLDVQGLSLFRQDRQIWADETRLSFKGETEASEVVISGHAPEEAPEAVLIASARSPVRKGFGAILLKDLADLGFLMR